MILGYLPQAIVTIRTRDTDGIAMPTFLALGLGSIFFGGAGHMSRQYPVGNHQCHHHDLLGDNIRDKGAQRQVASQAGAVRVCKG